MKIFQNKCGQVVLYKLYKQTHMNLKSTLSDKSRHFLSNSVKTKMFLLNYRKSLTLEIYMLLKPWDDYLCLNENEKKTALNTCLIDIMEKMPTVNERYEFK